jgi:hypothetical protein
MIAVSVWHEATLTAQIIFDDTLSVSEGAHAAPTTFNKASKLIVALTFKQSNVTLFEEKHFPLIVNFCAQCLGA